MLDLFFPYLSSDADRLALWGGIAAAAALFANLAERRRVRRARIDRVGLMPWTTLFLMAFLASVILLGLAAREWFNPA